MNIEALLGLGVDDEAKTRALADRLRGRDRAAQFFGMSTIDPLAQAAQSEQANVQQAAQRGGALRSAMQNRQAQADREAQAQAARAAEAGAQRDFEAQEGVLDRESALEIARQRARSAGSGMKPGQKERTLYTGAHNLIGQMDSADKLFGEFSDTQKAQADQPGGETFVTAAGKLLPEGVSRMIEENAVYTDPDVRRYRTKIARLESDFSKLASGLAVTGFEMTDRKRWSPYAEGISQKEREGRLGNLRELLGREKSTFEQYYPEYTLQEGSTGGMVQEGGADPEESEEPDYANMSEEELFQLMQARGLVP